MCMWLFFIDSMVLARSSIVWSSWSREILAVCHWHVKGASAGLCCLGRYEWRAKVPDSPWWPFNGSAAFSSHMVRKASLSLLYPQYLVSNVVIFLDSFAVSINWIYLLMKPMINYELTFWKLSMNVPKASGLLKKEEKAFRGSKSMWLRPVFHTFTFTQCNPYLVSTSLLKSLIISFFSVPYYFCLTGLFFCLWRD